MFTNFRGIAAALWAPTALAGSLALLDALVLEPEQLRVKRLKVAVNARTERRVGLRIAQLSDLHVGALGWRRGTMTRAMDVCNQEDVDVIVITGDLIGRGHGVDAALELLSTLRADIPRIAVLGNHDHVYGRRSLDRLLAGLQALGITLLCNQAAQVETPLGRVWFVGVDDGYSMRDDLQEALRDLRPQDSPRILLTHYPDVAEQLRFGEALLSLAGHTHAGQIRLPVLTHIVNNGHARTRYGHGLYAVNGNPLYVTSGLGMSGVPMRFRNRPELTIVELAVVGSQPSAISSIAC